MIRSRRWVRTFALALVVTLSAQGCSSGPSAPDPRTGEDLPDPSYPTVRSSMPWEREVGTVLLVVVGAAALGGVAYLNYLAIEKWFK